MNNYVKMWQNYGFKVEVKNAPKDAVTFDKIIIIFSEQNTIRRVALFSTKENKIVLEK